MNMIDQFRKNLPRLFPFWIARCILSVSFVLALTLDAMATTVILVTGAPGEAEYAAQFDNQADQWRVAAEKGGARVITIGTGVESPTTSDAESLRTILAAEQPDGEEPLWIVLNGHGTWDGKTARFNLRGPDISADDLSKWMKPVKRPAVIINTASSSAPFVTGLTAPERVVITATRSGSEQNITRFGIHLAAVLTDLTADLDTDGSVSLLEAFLAASRRTSEFYKTEGRLATEHAMVDDNGDGFGTPADWFKGLRAVRKSDKNAATDGSRARHVFLIPPASEKQWPEELLKQRETVEARIEALRETKATMKEDEYYSSLESLMIELAKLTEKAIGEK